jgi:hypothetical protein
MTSRSIPVATVTMTTSDRIRRQPRMRPASVLPVDLGVGVVRDARYLPGDTRYLLGLT